MAINYSLNKHWVALIGINRRYPLAPLYVRKADIGIVAGTCYLWGQAAPAPPEAKLEGHTSVQTAALP